MDTLDWSVPESAVFLLCVFVSITLLTWQASQWSQARFQQYREAFTELHEFRLREFFLFMDPRWLFVLNVSLMCGGAALAGALTGSWLVAICSGVLLAGTPNVLYRWLRQRRRARFEQQLPDALMLLAGSLRSGLGLSSSLQFLVRDGMPPINQEFALVLREHRMGMTLAHSLEGLQERMPLDSVVLVVSAMRVALDTGGGLAETLERTGETIRTRLMVEGKIRALTAQGKMQAWIVGLLPVGLWAVLDRLEAEAMAQLWHTPIGWATLLFVLVSESVGLYLIRRIVHIDV